MGDEVYAGGGQQKRWSPQELKKMMKKMLKSYKKSDEIIHSAEQQRLYDESIANKELEKNLQKIDENLKDNK